MRLHLLLRIEGAPSAWRTSGDTIIGDTTIRSGLRYSGIEISERTNPREGTLDFDSVSVRIVADDATAEFGRAPQLLTYLAESATAAASAIEVRSNVFLNFGDFVHVGSECMYVTDATTTSVSVTRARRMTEAQYHTIDDGANASEVPVWSSVPAWEGRRCTIQAATRLDYSDVTTIFRGRIEQAPYLSPDGTEWLIDIAHISAALEQDVGVPLDVTANVRGMKYGVSSAFGMTVDFITQFSLTGFYENVQSFLADLNTELDGLSITGIDKWWADAVTFPDRGDGFRIFFVTNGTPPSTIPRIHIGSAVDGFAFATQGGVNSWGPFTVFAGLVSDSSPATTLAASTVYAIYIFPDRSGIPSTLIGEEVGESLGFTRGLLFTTRPGDAPFFDSAATTPDETRDNVIALDDDIGAVVGDTLVLSGWPIIDTLSLRVTVDHGGNVFEVNTDALRSYCEEHNVTSVFVSADTRVALRKGLGVGDLSDFITAVIDASPHANTGNVPYLTSSDISPSSAEVTAGAEGIAALLNRDYNVSEPVSIKDLIAPELQLLALTMGTSSTGLIRLVPYSLPLSTTPVSATFDGARIATRNAEGGEFPGWITASDGIVSVVRVLAAKSIRRISRANLQAAVGERSARFLRGLLGADTSPDPREVIYRDISSISAHKNRGLSTMSIEPEVEALGDLSTAEASLIASRIVAVYGHPYEVVTFRALRDEDALGVLIGDVIAITSRHVINSTDGTRGVTARKARVIGRRVSFDPKESGAASVEITAMMAGGGTVGPNYAGYAPSAAITGATLVTGNTWDLTVTQSLYAPSGSDDLDFFTISDRVIARQTYDTTPASEVGTVSALSATVARVVFDGAAPWGGSFSGSYVLDFADASEGVTDAMAEYLWTADDTLALHDGTIARIFS